jgi:hypothetical protein
MPLREDSTRSSYQAIADNEEAAMAENNAGYAHLTYCLTANRDLVLSEFVESSPHAWGIVRVVPTYALASLSRTGARKSEFFEAVVLRLFSASSLPLDPTHNPYLAGH